MPPLFHSYQIQERRLRAFSVLRHVRKQTDKQVAPTGLVVLQARKFCLNKDVFGAQDEHGARVIGDACDEVRAVQFFETVSAGLSSSVISLILLMSPSPPLRGIPCARR